MNRTSFLNTIACAAIVALGFLAPPICAEQQGYTSPYSISLTVPMDNLLAADQAPPRNDWKLESKIPYEEWYSGRVRKDFGAWGPSPRHYPSVGDDASLTWRRQRVLAVAYKYIGLPYQHHHIPDWDPPSDWPWKEVAYGRNSKGVDCSDFTSWIYNYGLGIHLDTGIRQQAAADQLQTANGVINVRTIPNEGSYEELCRKLKAGDLLYIKNKQGDVAHVIMWVGEHGRSPDGAPLIIDCTGSDHTDCNGKKIPIGVHLRPFLPNEWYYKSFSHAHRILHEDRQNGA